MSAPHRVDHTIFSTSSSIDDATAELPNIRVDLHQEIAADNHGFDFRMIDVGGDDRPTSRYFGPHKFWGNLARDLRAPRIAWMLVSQCGLPVAASIPGLVGLVRRKFLILSYCDELHLRGDDAVPCVVHLPIRSRC